MKRTLLASAVLLAMAGTASPHRSSATSLLMVRLPIHLHCLPKPTASSRLKAQTQDAHSLLIRISPFMDRKSDSNETPALTQK